MTAASPKVVLITGASGGIGAAVALEAARKGHHLALVARRADRLEAVADQARALGVEVLTLPADLDFSGHPGGVSADALISDTVGRFGSLDVLINNAGIGLARAFSRAEPEAIRRQIEVNLVAPILLTRLALPHLTNRKGIVINVGSSITAVANPAFGVYGATKAGLAHWNDALRREVRHRGVRVCLVEPGPVATEFLDAVAAMALREDFTLAAELRRQPGSPFATSILLRPTPRAITARVETVARRIVRLINRPRRRISVLRRAVWPYRAVGGLFHMVPWLADVVVSRVARRMEAEESYLARSPDDAGSSR